MADVPTLDIPVPSTGGGVSKMASQADDAVMGAIMTGMAGAAAGQADNRNRRADQLAADSAAMWSVALTTPTVFAGMGFRTAQQSAGWPADTGTGTGGAPVKT